MRPQDVAGVLGVNVAGGGGLGHRSLERLLLMCRRLPLGMGFSCVITYFVGIDD